MEYYEDSVTGGQTPKTESAIDVALGVVKTTIGRTQETMTKFETVLASVLTHPEQPTECKGETVAAQRPRDTQLKSINGAVEEMDNYMNRINKKTQQSKNIHETGKNKSKMGRSKNKNKRSSC